MLPISVHAAAWLRCAVGVWSSILELLCHHCSVCAKHWMPKCQHGVKHLSEATFAAFHVGTLLKLRCDGRVCITRVSMGAIVGLTNCNKIVQVPEKN